MSSEHTKNNELIKGYKYSHTQTVEQFQKRYEIELKDQDAKYSLLESKFKS